MSLRRIPTLTTQADCWSTGMLTHPWWLTLSVSAGDLSRERLEEALRMVVERHEALRVVPDPEASTVWQHILDIEDVEVRIWDVVVDDLAWRSVESEAWPIGKARWAAGIIEHPERKLVMKLCHGITDQIGLQILAADLQQAMSSLQTGVPPSWRPAASLARIAEEEGSPAGLDRLRRNNEFVAAAFAPGWMLKPMPEWQVERRFFQTSVAIEQDCMRRFSSAAGAIGVPWQSLLRAAYIIAEEIVHAPGRIRVQSLSHNRDDDERRRCIANFAAYVPTMVDSSSALLLDPTAWARRLEAMLQASAEHWPLSDIALTDVGLGVGDGLTSVDDPTFRVPHLEIETSSTAIRPGIAIEGNGNRVGPLQEVDTVWRPTEVVLFRRPGEVLLVLGDHSVRRSPDALRLLAACFLGVVESYAGLTGTKSTSVLGAARELRDAVGRWPYLDWPDDTLVAVTPSAPSPVSEQAG